MGILKPLEIEERPTGFYLKLFGDFKQGNIVYLKDFTNNEAKGYYEVVDTSYKDKNLYLCIKKK